MALEFEAKFVNINPKEIEEKLSKMGAAPTEEKLFRSISFDYPGFPMDKVASWVRLRNEGDRVTLAYKKRLGVTTSNGNDSGMEEVQFNVDDFEKTKEFLLKIGMVVKFAQEKKRKTWIKDGVHYDLDTWPKLDTYLEIEASSMEEVDNCAKELGINLENKKVCSATQIYQMAGINDKEYTKMNFDEFVKRI